MITNFCIRIFLTKVIFYPHLYMTFIIFAKEGAKVSITDMQEEKLKGVVAEIKADGGTTDYFVHDVTSEESWKAAAEKAVSLFGKIDVLVNNAGILGDVMGPLEERTVEEFNKVLSVNLTGQFIGVKTVVPYMRKIGGGSIINISSVGGITGSSNGTAYTASKGGSRIYTKGAAVELAKDNIRVNSVHPGYVATPMTTTMKGSGDFEKGALSITPMGRGARLEEIAYAVLFLATDESSFMTGSELIIDGGLTAL
jgi:cyclopentanol dehydrogenase